MKRLLVTTTFGIALSGCVPANETPQQAANRMAVANAMSSAGAALTAQAQRPMPQTAPQTGFLIPARPETRCISTPQGNQLVTICR